MSQERGAQSDLLSMHDSTRDNPLRNMIETSSPYTKRPSSRNKKGNYSKTIDAASLKQ